MTPEAFENALIAEIQALNIPVIPFPQRPGDYYPEAEGEVLVRYVGRNWNSRNSEEEIKDLSGAFEQVTLTGEVMVVTQQVRGLGGAYEWLQLILERLNGLTLEGAVSPLWIEQEMFVTEKEGIWQFAQTWAMKTVRQNSYTDPNMQAYGTDGDI